MCETLYKIISKTATSRINNKLEEVRDIDQNGFVPGRSTQHTIAVAINNITEAEQQKKPVAIDIESAFNPFITEIFFCSDRNEILGH